MNSAWFDRWAPGDNGVIFPNRTGVPGVDQRRDHGARRTSVAARITRSRGAMDTHTLELLEFEKVRMLVAARAASSLGKAAAGRIEPSLEPGEIHNRQTLTTEMVEALARACGPLRRAARYSPARAPRPEGKRARGGRARRNGRDAACHRQP